MAAKSKVRRELSATVAAIEKHSGRDDPRIPGLRSELAAERLAEDIAAAPPLTDAQLNRLAVLLFIGGSKP